MKGAQNRMLFKTLDDMRVISRTLEARRRDPVGSIDLSMVARTFRDHARLLRALRRRDGDAADHWMRQQIRVGRDQHLRLLRERAPAAPSTEAAAQAPTHAAPHAHDLPATMTNT